MQKKYFWLKLKKDFFNQKGIKKMRKMPNGDTYVIIYLKMQLMSIMDNGTLFYEGIEEDFASEIALALDEDESAVRTTLKMLEHCGLVERISDSELFLTKVPEVIGSETDKASAMRKKRAEEKMSKEPRSNNVTCVLPTVTKCYPEIELEQEPNSEIKEDTDKKLYSERKEKEVKEKKEAKEAKEETKSISEDLPKEAVLFNSICLSLPPVKKMTELRREKVQAASEILGDEIETFFSRVEQSDFLTGRNGEWNTGETQANFDWIMKPDNIAHILQGRYDNHSEKRSNSVKKRQNPRILSSFTDEDLMDLSKFSLY